MRYRCALGYQQRLNPLVRCLSTGRWERPQVLCVPGELGVIQSPKIHVLLLLLQSSCSGFFKTDKRHESLGYAPSPCFRQTFNYLLNLDSRNKTYPANLLSMEVRNLHHPNFYYTNSNCLGFSLLYSFYLLFCFCLLVMVFVFSNDFWGWFITIWFSEPGTPTLNPEVTSETNSNFEEDMTPKKKPLFWDIKF